MKKYKRYQQIDVKGFGTIPDHWKLKKARYYFSFSKGLSITKENLVDTGVPCVSYGEIHSDFGFEVNPDIHSLNYVSFDYMLGNDKSMLYRGDIVFADTSEDIEGSGNFTQLNSDVETFAGYHTIVARLKTNDNYRFIAYVLDSLNYRQQIRSQVKGVKVYSITNKILKDTFLWSPSIKEQLSIASFLDHKTSIIDALIEKKEQLIEKLKLQRQAIINELVTGKKVWDEQTKTWTKPQKTKDSGIEWLGEIPEEWEVRKLKYFAKIHNGKDQKDVIAENGTFPILGTGGEFGRTNEFLYDKPSVLLGRKGTVDKPFYIDEPFWTVDTLFYTSIKSNVYPKFFFYSCKTINFDLYQESSAVPSMTQEKLNNVEICYTKYVEQVQISKYIDDQTSKIDFTITKLVISIEKLKLYRQSLISEAVTGKIDVRDWEKENN